MYVRMSFGPESVGNSSSSPPDESQLSPRSIQTELFSACPDAQLQEITVNPFSIQLVQVRLHSPIGSKKTYCSIRWTIAIVYDSVGSTKADGDFLQLCPWRRGKQLWINHEERSYSSWGAQDQCLTFSGQKLMRTYWKEPFQRTAIPTA